MSDVPIRYTSAVCLSVLMFLSMNVAEYSLEATVQHKYTHKINDSFFMFDL